MKRRELRKQEKSLGTARESQSGLESYHGISFFFVVPMIVIIDNTSSTRRFLPKLKQYLDIKGIAYICVRTVDELSQVPPADIHGYILSGSSMHVHDLARDQYLLNMMPLLKQGAVVMGICLGAQFLHLYYGGTLEKLRRLHCQDFMVRDPKGNFRARFCNRYVFKDVATSLVPTAHYEVEGRERVCAFKHKKKPIYGVLFHPEHSASTYPILDAFVDRTRVLAHSS